MNEIFHSGCMGEEGTIYLYGGIASQIPKCTKRAEAAQDRIPEKDKWRVWLRKLACPGKAFCGRLLNRRPGWS